MKYFIITILLFMTLLAGCSGEDEPLLETSEPSGTVTVTAEVTEVPALPEATNTPLSKPVGEEEATPTTPPAPTREASGRGHFINLRFASSAEGEAQLIFPLETQDVYALWEYEGMKAGDEVRRLWFLNEQLYAEKNEGWDLDKYGSSGTVRDVFMYDYIDGIDAGQWRVELYLNGTQEIAATFTVQ